MVDDLITAALAAAEGESVARAILLTTAAAASALVRQQQSQQQIQRGAADAGGVAFMRVLQSAVLIRLTPTLSTSLDVEHPWAACSREVNSEVDGREAAIPWSTCVASNRACRRICAKGGGYVRQCSPQDQEQQQQPYPRAT